MVSANPNVGQKQLTAYLAPEELEGNLEQELTLLGCTIIEKYGRLFIADKEIKDVIFAQDTWFNLEYINYKSISDAAKILKSKGLKIYHYSVNMHRRAELILQHINTVKVKKYNFLDEIPNFKIGAFSLLSESQMIFSAETKAKLPYGEISFNEDKVNPPSRAYLKLWELFTLYKIKPGPGEKVADMGSCPGGWTWVLQTIGCHVLSVDKAEIDPRIMALPNVKFLQESAFGLRPMHIGKIDWFFSDIICYPAKLYELVNRWRDSGLCSKYVCTVKLQVPIDFETLFKFKAIPNSEIIHLSCNKNEVTWILK